MGSDPDIPINKDKTKQVARTLDFGGASGTPGNSPDRSVISNSPPMINVGKEGDSGGR